MCCTKPSAPVGGRREAPQQEQRWRLSRCAKPRLRAHRRHRTSRVQLCRSCIILAKQAPGETVVSVPAGLRDGPRSDPAGPRDRLEGKKPPNRLWLGTACSALQKPCHGSKAVQHQQAWHVLALPAGSLEYLTALTEIPLCFFLSQSWLLHSSGPLRAAWSASSSSQGCVSAGGSRCCPALAAAPPWQRDRCCCSSLVWLKSSLLARFWLFVFVQEGFSVR